MSAPDMKAADPGKPARFAIVSDADQPAPRMVAEWIEGVGYCYCQRTGSDAYRRVFDGMLGAFATPLEDFGWTWAASPTGEVLFTHTGRKSIATYSDGAPRRWQAPLADFTLLPVPPGDVVRWKPEAATPSPAEVETTRLNLAKMIADPAMTVIIATANDGFMARETFRPEPSRLVAIAQSLLAEAADLLDGQDEPDPDSITLRAACAEALAVLPDPDADDDGGGGGGSWAAGPA